MSLAALRMLMTSPTKAGESRLYWSVPLMLSVAEVNQLLSVDDGDEALRHHPCGAGVERSRCVGVGCIGEGG